MRGPSPGGAAPGLSHTQCPAWPLGLRRPSVGVKPAPGRPGETGRASVCPVPPLGKGLAARLALSVTWALGTTLPSLPSLTPRGSLGRGVRGHLFVQTHAARRREAERPAGRGLLSEPRAQDGPGQAQDHPRRQLLTRRPLPWRPGRPGLRPPTETSADAPQRGPLPQDHGASSGHRAPPPPGSRGPHRAQGSAPLSRDPDVCCPPTRRPRGAEERTLRRRPPRGAGRMRALGPVPAGEGWARRVVGAS